MILTFFFFNDTATTEIYTLSLHDALPISRGSRWCAGNVFGGHCRFVMRRSELSGFDAALSQRQDRKSTRLNSSHLVISYAVFCLKKKKNNNNSTQPRQTTTTPITSPDASH